MVAQSLDRHAINPVVKEYLELTEKLGSAAFVFDQDGYVLSTNEISQSELGIHEEDKILWKHDPADPEGKKVFINDPRSSERGEISVNAVRMDSLSPEIYLAVSDPIRSNEFKISQDILHTIFQIVPGMMYRCANDKLWTMQFLSEQALQVTGYPPEDLINNTKVAYADLIHEDDRARIWEEVQTALNEDRPFHLLYRLVKPGGEIRWMEEEGRFIKNGEGASTSLEGWIIDITERKATEDALIESETRYRTLIQASPDAVIMTDLKGVIRLANQQMVKIMEVTSEDELIGKKITRLLEPQTKKESLAHILENLSCTETYREKHPAQSLTGRKFPVEVSIQAIPDAKSKPSAYIIVMRDISALEKTLQALRTSAAYYRAIVEDNPEMIVRFTEEATVTFANLAYASFYGLQRNELLGARLIAVIPASYRPAIQKIISSVSPDMKPLIKEHCVKKKNGDLHWYRWKTIAIHDEAGEFIEYQSIGEDITDEKNAEDAREKAEQRLRDLMENIKLAALILDTNGKINFCNSYYSELTGFKQLDLLNNNWLDGFVPFDEAVSLKKLLLESSLTGKLSSRLDGLILTKSGEQKLIAWNNTLLTDQWGEVSEIALIGEDITDKRITEKTQEAIYKITQAANESLDLNTLYYSIHQILKGLMPVENFFIALYDNETRLLSFPYYVDQFDEPPEPMILGRGLTEYVLRTGKTILANPEVFNLLIEEEEVVSVGSPSVDWLGAPLRIGSKVIGVMVTQTYTENVRLNKRDEQMFNFVSTQVAMAIDRKRAEQALRLSQRRNELLVQASTDGIVLETLEGDILDCNHVFEEMYGYTKEELQYMKIQDLVPEEFRKDKPDYIAWELNQGGFLREVPNMRRDGSIFPVEVSTRLTTIDQAEFVVAYVRDITERKESEQAIVESEAKFRTLAETAAAGIFIHRGSRNLYVNPTWCQITGYPEDELLKMDYSRVVVPEDERNLRSKFLNEHANGTSENRVEVRIETKTKETKWLDITIGTIEFEGEKAFIGTAVDITKRMQREHELEVVAKISEALRASLSRDEVNQTILKEILNLMDIDGALIATIEEGRELQLLEHGIGCWSPLNGLRLKIGEGLSGYVVVSGKVYVNNHASHEKLFTRPDLVQKLASIIGVPMIAKGETIGAILIGSAHILGDHDLQLLSAIGNLAAGAIHRSDLHDQTLRQATELKIAYDATLEGWAHALELRDKETQGHSLRIANMTLKLAKRLGYRDEDLENVRRGALLHDIGKMGIPDTILLKPDRLTADEWGIMQKHPEYAYQMLSQQPYFKQTLDIPYCHHEWWDGTGYPRGLRGKSIPLVARIFSIVDSWDALISDRPYRKAWTKQEALIHIADQSGSHFDPEVVSEFVEMIKEEFPDIFETKNP